MKEETTAVHNSSNALQLFQGLGKGEFVISIFQRWETSDFWCDFIYLDICFSLDDNAPQVSWAVPLNQFLGKEQFENYKQ